MMLVLPPLAAETMFYVSGFPITNSYINSTLALIGFAVFAFFVNKGIKKYYLTTDVPKGILNFAEGLIEFMLGYFDQVTGDRKKSYKFLPIVGTFFLFIVVSNWMGLMPGTGSIGIWNLHHGSVELIPLLRPANTDLNMTLSMAVIAVMGSHLLGIAAIGFFKYANKFIKLGDLFKAIISFNPVKILVAVIEFFVGLIEIFSEAAKMVSLSLRLYGNIFAGEVLLTVLASMLAIFLPLPFMGLEIIVGLIQAVVFSMLTLVYLNMATAEIHHAEGH
jgi:F-type H+-transporting ATPase subunit a